MTAGCYRRDDAAYPAGWLFDLLADHFGAGRVFKDVDSIQPGDDFVEEITAAVGACAVLLAVIGTRWLVQAREDGRRRLDDLGDLVRLEIEAALARDVRVIPVLVDGAPMPGASQLPASLEKLAGRQAIELSPSHFSSDARRLLRTLDMTLAQVPDSPARPPTTIRPETTAPGQGEAVPEQKAPAAHRDQPGVVAAAVLARLETYGSPHVRQAYDGLAGIGYLLHPSVPRDWDYINDRREMA